MRPVKNSNPFLFASEADQVALLGGVFIAVAIFALVMDRLSSRRERLARLDRVGWVPWTLVFLACAIIGGGLLALSLPTALFSQ
ncbi:MAG: hypothetical protein HKP43_05320 [Altererythrobacter sp.]|nr:hypothetical protein [Altererythrobacter sp.]MBT8432563.1 hypothetical protein [Altererythrobacter sp.]NNE50418.1 hypothetical protein [Altererythrobacter sp.]NNF94481.1 hypothetical protein [Altererythrobacter sp.]NNK46032.1 hypothetical protein [Altererythrobacter sp.]